MLEKPSYEFHAVDSHGLCLPAIPVILVFKRHCAVIISSDAAVGYGGPVRILGKIAYSIASAVEGLLYKWKPSFLKSASMKAFHFSGSSRSVVCERSSFPSA